MTDTESEFDDGFELGVESMVEIDVAITFGFDDDLIANPSVYGFTEPGEHVPELDPAYRFDPASTAAILAGFVHNRRVLLVGAHGAGKSTHIEQVAARLNWPCVRVNLDGHVTRTDLVGHEAIVIRNGVQVTEFQPGVLPWALQRPCALVFDELDAGQPEVMFVIHRVLERAGHFTLLDQNRVLRPHRQFRLFATANTIGSGDLTGQYHGTHPINQAQIDRWDIVAQLDYPAPATEAEIVAARVPALFARPSGPELIDKMVILAGMTRIGFAAGDLRVPMSPRTVISWAENVEIFASVPTALRYAYLNACDPDERSIVGEYHQRVFGTELS